MKKAKMTMWLVMFLAVTAVNGLCQVHFNDGDTHIIDYEINNSVHVDKGEAYAETKTTVNFVEGGRIPQGSRPKRNYLGAYNQSTAVVSGGYVDWLVAYGSSTVAISGGSVGSLEPYGTVDISGGSVSTLWADNLIA